MLRRRPADAPTLSDRAAPLIEEAAERSRVSWRTRVERLRLAWRSIFQASVSAALAWLIATEVLGHSQPFFAPVSAIITLGITVGQRGQRAAEVALGVALGIAVADLLVLQIGTGTAQLALVVLLATSAAIFLGSGQMLATQAAVSAALVATLQPPTDGVSFERFIDALVGGGVALVINALVLPARPLDLMRRASEPLLAELAAVLDDVAVAVERRDKELRGRLAGARAGDRRARRPLRGGGRREPRDDPLRPAAPALARRRGELRRRRRAGSTSPSATCACSRAARSARSRSTRTCRPRSPARCATSPPRCGRSPARSTTPTRVEAVREPAVRAAAEATQVLESTGNMSVSVIVGQIRSTAADLLAATGMGFERRRRRGARGGPRGRGARRDGADLGAGARLAGRAARPRRAGARRRAARGRLAAVRRARAADGLGRADAVGAAGRPRRPTPSPRRCGRSARS